MMPARLRLFLSAVALVLCAGLAAAGSIEPKSASLQADERGQLLSADFGIDLGPRLEEAVGRGVPLNFRFEFTLSHKRWYWADEHVAGRILKYRLSYQALTRQYRLSLGNLHQNFATLEEALHALGHVARLQVVDKGVLKPGETYHAAVRLSLDREQLPKPLQVDALADREWFVEAKILRWDFVAAEEKPQ